jgi:plastocyanin
MRRAAVLAIGVTAAVTMSCGGGGGGGGGGSGTCTPVVERTMTISATGVSPTAVCVLPGGRVTFTNNDTVAHDVQGDASCSALNLGTIAPTTSKVATLPAVQTCTFHDTGTFATNVAFQGTVAVATAVVSGAGY